LQINLYTDKSTTFVACDQPMEWLAEYCDHITQVEGREIGTWEHTTLADLPHDLHDEAPMHVAGLAALQPF
jgi:hypothetical protein